MDTRHGNVGEPFGEDLDRQLTEADDRELVAIDKALKEAKSARTQESAMAALTRATARLNAYYVTPALGPLNVLPVEGDVGQAFKVYSLLPIHRRQATDAQQKWEERLAKYLAVVKHLVEKYQPDQYQVSVGFPQLVSVTMVWKVTKPSGV